MEKYILRAVFMLTMINTASPDVTLARDAGAVFIGNSTSDSSKSTGKIYLKEFRSHRRPLKRLNPDELDSVSRFLILEADTGKYFRRFYFKDAPMNKRFVDSLILNLPENATLRKFRSPADSIYRPWGRHLPDHRDNSIEMPNMLRRNFPGMRNDRFEMPDRVPRTQKNSQSFSFRNTDKDGITTRMQVDVSDPSVNELDKISVKASNNALNIQNLSFSPDFSTGRIMLMFSIEGKGDLDIKVLSNDFNVVFIDSKSKFSGTYQSALSLPRNGIYYLLITRQDKMFVKRIVKTE